MVQDRDWEAPYLAIGDLSHELEKITARIRPLVARVVGEDLDPGFRFSSTIRDTAASIGAGLPEWMDGSWEPFELGPETTGCLLEAEWHLALRAGTSPFAYLTSILELDDSLENAGLDDKAVAAFVSQLPAVARREMLDGIDAHRDAEPWGRALARGHPWSRTAKLLTRRRKRRSRT